MNIRDRQPYMEIHDQGTLETRTIRREDLLKKLQESGSDEEEKNKIHIENQFYKKLTLFQLLTAQASLVLDISTDRIHYLVVKRTNGKMQVKFWGVEELNQEELDRYRAMEISLKYIHNKVYRSGMKVQVGFFSPDINVRQVVIPKLKPAEIRKTLLYKNRTDLTNFNDDTIWTYEILETFTENNTEKVRVLVTVVPGEIIDIYLDILKRAGFKPDSLLPRPFAFLSAYRQMVKSKKNDVLIDINSDTTQICFFVDGKLRFVRNFAIGSNNLKKAINTAPDNRNGNGKGNGSGIQTELIEPSKEKSPALEKIDSSDIRKRLLKKVQMLQSKQNPLLQVLLGEIMRSLEFFRGSRDEYPINNIYITGLGLQLEAIYPYLKNRINYPVHILAPKFKSLSDPPGDYAEFTGAIGIAANSDKKLNMVPAEFRHREIFKNLNMLISAIFIIFLVFATYLTLLEKSKLSSFRQSAQLLKEQYLNINPVERVYYEMIQQIRKVEQEKRQLLSPIKPVPELIQVMKLFSNEVPAEIRLTALEFNLYHPGNDKSKKEKNKNYRYRIGVVGQINSNFLMGDVILINFINHLDDLGYFKKLQLKKKYKDPENKLFEFELEAFL